MLSDHAASESTSRYPGKGRCQQKRTRTLTTEVTHFIQDLVAVALVQPIGCALDPVSCSTDRVDGGAVGVHVGGHRRQLLTQVVQDLYRIGPLGFGLLTKLRAGLAQKIAGPLFRLAGDLPGSLLPGPCDVRGCLLPMISNISSGTLGLTCGGLFGIPAGRAFGSSRGWPARWTTHRCLLVLSHLLA